MDIMITVSEKTEQNIREKAEENGKEIAAFVEEIVLPIPAITETAYFVSKNLGAFAHADFVHGLPDMNVNFEAPNLLKTSFVPPKFFVDTTMQT